MNKAYKKFHKLVKILGTYSGGAVEWKDVKFLESLKPKSPTLYHVETFYEDGHRIKVMVALVEEYKKTIK